MSKAPASTRKSGRFWLAAIGLVAVLGSFGLAVAAYFSAVPWVDHALEVRATIDTWLTGVHEMEAAGRRAVEGGRPRDLTAFSQAVMSERAVARRLQLLVADNPEQRRDAEASARDADALTAPYRDLVSLVAVGHQREALAALADGSDETRPLAERVTADATRMLDREATLLHQRRTTAKQRVLTAIASGTALGLIAFGLLIAAWSSHATREALLDRAAVEARQRLKTLSELAVALSEVRTVEEVAEAVVSIGMQALAADTCTLYLLDEAGLTLELIGERGVAPTLVEKIRKMSASEGNPIAFETLKTGTAIWAESETDYQTLFPSIAAVAVEGRRAKAFWSMPLIVEKRPVGLLGMGFYEERTFSAGDKLLVETFGLHCAQALRRTAREEAERKRRDFLGQAGETLVSSLDYQATLATVARLAVPVFADWCSINVLEPGAQAPYQAAVAHADPKKLELARELGQRYPPDPNAKTGAPEVIRTGKSLLYAEIPPALLNAAAKDEEHRRLIHELGLRSAIVVPLRTARHTLGAMTFVYAESNRRYSEEDRAFAEDFARRAAMALENALVLREVEQSRAEERKLRGEAEVASRAKDEFLAMVSHELRTPLNAILGWTVMLRAPNAAENLERGLAVIERNARAQAKLIEDVLNVSRIISGKLSLSLGPTTVADVISASIETVAPAAQAKSIAVTASVPTPPIVLTADAQRIQQVVWNLLSNAVKFTPKGGQISIGVSLEGSDVRLEVSDNGEGIRPESLPHVFEPFQQADASTTRRHGGLGLGLAIVKQLVVAHGGTVTAHSAGTGQGARFVVELPARSQVAAIAGSPRTAPEARLPGAPKLDGLRLLVVDDEEDALTLVTRVLMAHGAEVFAAASAKDALVKLATLRPDVIVSDIGMPDVDGYALIRKIRALPADRGGRTPAVALTAYARAEDAQRAFSAGYQLHIAKPIEPSQLAHVVANLGGRSVESD